MKPPAGKEPMTRTLVLSCLLVPAIAAADPHPMASGASPAPAGKTDVALTEETLTIAIGLRDASVTAAITLVNQGAATAFDVGFPCATGEDAGRIDVPCKVPLTVTVNGKAVRTTKAKSHRVWRMKFAANETVALVVTYKAPLINPRYTIPAAGMGLFTYRLTTGADWAGPIGKLAIEVDHLNDALMFISPAGYQRAPGKITWSLTNVEPMEEVVIMPAPGVDTLGAFSGKTLAAKRKQLEDGDYKKTAIESSIQRLTDEQSSADRWRTLITKLGSVPAPSLEQVNAATAESLELLHTIAAHAKQ